MQRAVAVHARARVILPCFMGDPDPRLERVGGPLDDAGQTLWLVTDADLVDSARVRAVSDLLVEAVGARGAELEGASSTG